MDRSESLTQLARDAAQICHDYPHATAHLQAAVGQIELCRVMDASARDLAATQAHYAACRRLCQEIWGCVDSLARQTATLMPEISQRLLFVRPSTTLAWHEIPEFDWQAALAELRDVLAEASARADQPTS